MSVQEAAIQLPVTGEGLGTLLLHADRCWKAEEANATRIAGRANLVLSGVTAVLGLKLYSASAEIRTILQAEQGYITLIFWSGAILGLCGLLYCLKLILEIKIKSSKKSASEQLYLGELKEAAKENVPKNRIEEMVFLATYDAAQDLQKRNMLRDSRVNKSQIAFFISAILLFVSLAAYTVTVYYESLPETQLRKQSAP